MRMIYKDSQVLLTHFTTDQAMMQGMTMIPSNASGVRRICQAIIVPSFAVNSAHLNTMEKTLMSQSYDWCQLRTIKTTIMGYNTDWNGVLNTSRPFTKIELDTWNEMTRERHDSQYGYEDHRREFPSIWCNFEISNHDNKGLFSWNETEKTYEGIGWIKHFLKFLIECSKDSPIYAEGIMYWQGDDSEDMGYISVEKNRIRTFEGTIEYHEIACEYILQPTNV